ncbi:hypothetical protein SAMN05443428_10435 [Caloramator quimbayensis]|uniref:Uncharacterized protein n=1 Tax=Caloramator quimbayensis TaxID=1147123 RepID=A0A1T4WVU2_9CLOT|nr:YeeE/YedE thiosulfate transporter family protein [Caloramator quimbayensis]SKA81247.1 hypothetical protein SAMN05443428_10435 [Caloramator quimbayensis]
MSEVVQKSIKTNSKSKKKVNQIPFGVVLLIGLIGFGFFMANQSPKSAVMWVFGVAAGFTLQRSRFCFTASMRDPVLTGSTSLTKAVIIAIATATVGFASIQYGAVIKGAEKIPGNISPVGIHVAIGAFMFGIGMVIAGGCASGTLMRVGEGFTMQMLSIVFFIIGSLWGAKDFGWWTNTFISKTKPVFLPNLIGWAPALLIQFGLLLALYILADWYGNRKSE